MREARNDEVHACNTLFNRTCIRTRSPCTVLLRIKDAFSLSEAGYQYIRMLHQSPVCTRFARLDWGYERFSLSEAVS